MRSVLLGLAAAILAGCGNEPPPPPKADAPLGPRVFPMGLAPALDDPGRDAWQCPDEVMAVLAVRPGERVADVGCGTGYFTRRLLAAAGPTGRVLAVDLQQGMLDLLSGRLSPAERERVVLRRNAPDRPLEKGDALDLVLCANTLNEVDDADQAAFVRSMAEGLAPGGRLAILNWIPSRTRLGPPVEQRITPVRVKALAGAAGLRLAAEPDTLPMHSLLVFVRADPGVGEKPTAEGK